VWHTRNIVFGQELLNCHGPVSGSIVMQRPVLSLLRPFSPNTFAQMRQNVHIENSTNTCPCRYEFAVHYSFIIEKFHQHDLDVGFCCLGLLGARGQACVPFG
jgi:hypothetical protein